MKKYEAPEFQVIDFMVEDVITASATTTDPNELPFIPINP